MAALRDEAYRQPVNLTDSERMTLRSVSLSASENQLRPTRPEVRATRRGELGPMFELTEEAQKLFIEAMAKAFARFGQERG